MFKNFDKATKLVFRSRDEASYIKFGSMRDRDPQHRIRNGQIMLTGYESEPPRTHACIDTVDSREEVASLFDPSISGIKQAICKQSLAAVEPVSVGFCYLQSMAQR